MPGLLTLRPLASAAKAAKGATAKNAAVGSARAEKARDDARAQGQGKGVPSTFARARVLRAPAVHRTAPAAPPPGAPYPPNHHHHHQQQQQAAVPAQVQQQQKGTTFALGGDVVAAVQRNGLEISQRMGGADYSSSGSEHEPNSVCLAEMVFDYIEEDLDVSKCGRARCNCSNTCSSGDRSHINENDESNLGGEITDVLLGLTPCVTACERNILASVTSAVEALEGDDDGEREGHESTRSCFTRRLVMSALRSSGYNAAICKSRWEHAGGFPGGDYEYIDVIQEGGGGVGKSERILVDIDFQAQFEIARPTSLYSALVQSLPSVFVGRPDRLQQIVNVMCDGAKRSLKKKGMHLPPWRKPEYIRAKWFSAYRRTTNGVSLNYKSQDGSTTDIGQIALRGSGWDVKFTADMEKSYHNAVDRRMALRDTNGGGQQLVSRAMLRTSTIIPRKLEESDEPEGQVRGANLMGLLGHLGNTTDRSAVNGDVTAPPTEWEPPVVIPRTSTQRAAGGKVGGLVFILRHSSEPKEDVVAPQGPESREQRTARQPLTGLSKQMVV